MKKFFHLENSLYCKLTLDLKSVGSISGTVMSVHYKKISYYSETENQCFLVFIVYLAKSSSHSKMSSTFTIFIHK